MKNPKTDENLLTTYNVITLPRIKENVKNKDNDQLGNSVVTCQRFLRANIERLKCLDVI